MNSVREYCRQLALTPKTQMKRLAIGTCGAIVSMLTIIFTSELENSWLFYGLSTVLVISILYALPGYIGIWLWRMRKTLFNID